MVTGGDTLTIGDYHVHSRFSLDCDEPMQLQCQAAVRAGLSEIAFTEHVDHDECDTESEAYYDRAGYETEIEHCRDLYGDQIHILKAAEIDFNNSIAADVDRFLSTHEHDFVIGSVHNINHVYIGHSGPDSFGGARNMYDQYLDQVEIMVETGFPDVVGHLDLPRRYHGVSMEETDADYFEQRLRRIFRIAAEREVGFELNTSGIRRRAGSSLPSPQVIKWFVEEGGQIITIGSDSHFAADTGHSIREVHQQLGDLGIGWRTSFVNGERRQVAMEVVV